MISRIKALSKTFNLLLTAVELLIGLRFAVGIFGSDDTINKLPREVGVILGQIGYGVSGAMRAVDMQGPVAILVLVLGFMIFSFVLITIVPKVAERMERDIDADY